MNAVARKLTSLDRAISAGKHIRLEKSTVGDAIFHHAIMSQICLPYRSLGKKTFFTHEVGDAKIILKAGLASHPITGEVGYVGLPYGAKARLLMAYIDNQAKQSGKRTIYIENSMTAFIKQVGFNVDGYTIRSFKDQLLRIKKCSLQLERMETDKLTKQRFKHETSLSFVKSSKEPVLNLDDSATDIKIINGIDAWYPKDPNQRVLWDSELTLSEDYFNSLMDRAVPLDVRALAGIAQNALALDIYTFLAHRLHRTEIGRDFIDWANIKKHFGAGYSHMYKFKQKFRQTLTLVKCVYPQASIGFVEVPNKGFRLKKVAPPIPYEKKVFQVSPKPVVKQTSLL